MNGPEGNQTQKGRPVKGKRQPGCDEYVNLQRRQLLQSMGAAMDSGAGRTARRNGAKRVAAASAMASSLPQVRMAGSGGPARDIIVYVMLRGGMDGLSLCVPHADPDYATLRGGLAIPAPGSLGGALPLDSFFGLNPAAAALMPAYQSGELLFVHTAGSTDPTRSHFDAMKFIEGGVPNQNAAVVTSGWLGRHVAQVPAMDPAAGLRAVAVDSVAPLTLAGAPKSLAIPTLAEFDLAGWSSSRSSRQAKLREMYQPITGPIGQGALSTLDNIDALSVIDFEGYAPSGGAVYPDSTFGNRFKSSAALIKSDLGVEVLEIDRGGWDHHENQGPQAGQFADKIGELAEALAAFRTDLGGLMNSVTVVCQSEFGRRVDANGSDGTDHGRGGCMMVMGGNVNGGQVMRDWIGLDPAILDELALPVRIDYRDILIEILEDRAANPSALSLFPNHTFTNWNAVQ